MKSEKYRKIYSMIVGNVNNVLEGTKTDDLFNGIDEFLVEKNDLPLLKELYSVQTTEEDSVSLLVALAIKTKMLKFIFEANAAEAFTTLRRNKEWHLLYHSFDEVMPDNQIYKQCYPVQRMIFDSRYCERVQQSAEMICRGRFEQVYGQIKKIFDFSESRLLQVILAEDDEEAESMDLLINEKRAVNLMYLSGILDDAISSVLAQKYYATTEEHRGTFMLRLFELARGSSPTTLLTAEIFNDLLVRIDDMEKEEG